ncbi:CvpA family protein [Bacteroides helcogenes]|uniref:Colicin V production protein n=1 Tax=Bacteroides helcogenes (strain ATCC 35417 / DSM 20613 / JCM 6297 / CCUG 15421 / P 36-108) TaxID=693979 RepID=E6SW16_BACT6|nr:CvpA family protein [Bacteroides helcogenes]ADV42541.1 Colicin V production protein [Bacteroides helcogenes P 36-108]MDY5237697.1 CvpA family protein [Bacteroides helcogenes]
MTTIDILIIIAFGTGAVIGFMKGLIKQLASVLGLVVGLLAAKALYAPLAAKLCPTVTDSMTFAQILAFVIIWVVVPLGFSIVASMLTKAMEAISLGWLNRWLGSGLGALKYLLLVSLLIGVIEFVDGDNKLISQTKKQESALYYPMNSFGGIFLPAAKHVTEQFLLKNHATEESERQK